MLYYFTVLLPIMISIHRNDFKTIYTCHLHIELNLQVYKTILAKKDTYIHEYTNVTYIKLYIRLLKMYFKAAIMTKI